MTPRPTLLGLLRTLAVLAGALTTTTLLPRLGVPASFVPDLVVLVAATTAVVRGSLHGALVGLAAGWVVDLVPPGGSPLGATALLFALAGAAAGRLHHPGNRAALAPAASVAVAALVVEGGRLALLLLSSAPTDVHAAGTRTLVTVGCGLLLAPLAIGVDRALVRRRLA